MKILQLKNILTYITFICITITSHSQIKIKGLISDNKTNKPIPYATVLLKNSENSFLTGTTTNEEGKYILKYDKGNYTIQVNFMGFKTLEKTIILDKNQTQSFLLFSEATIIDEVIITAEITTIRQLIDKKIINVGKDILSSGGSAATVLSQLSEVDADESGNIALRGNSNVQVLVNGKPSPLSNAELLAQIPSSEIKNIEIITSPSAKYKADGLTGIINILTKKKVRKGITVSNTGSINSLKEFSGSTTLAYGKKKINYSVGAYYRKNRSTQKRTRERFGTFPYSEESDNKYQGAVYRLNTGMDWFPNKNNEFSWNATFSNNTHHTDTEKTISEANTSAIQSNYSSHLHRTLQLNGNYRHSFKNEIDFLELDIHFSNNKNTLKGFFQPNITSDNIIHNKILTSNIALDNVVQVSEIFKLETGYLWHKQELDNTKSLFDATDIAVSETFYTTQEATHALYVQGFFDFGKLAIQTGLRAELYNRKAIFVTNNTNVDNTFTDFFPSLHLKYEPNETHTFGIGYNRRTSRPRLYQVNPITQQHDAFSLRIGNPHLKPEFSNNIDFSYQFQKDKFSVSPTFSYRKNKSIILQNLTITNDGVQVTSYANSRNSNSYNFELAISYKPVKWLKSNFTFNWNYEDIQSSDLLFPIEFSRNYQFNFKNDIQLYKKLSANISWRYRAPSISFYNEREESQRFDIGFRQKIFNNNGTVSLRFTDIFNSFIYKGVELGDSFYRNYKSKRESRAIHLTFSYNFRKGDLEKRKKKKRNYE